jgi:RNA polymerase sigma-70 factor (ECF subfamily)
MNMFKGVKGLTDSDLKALMLRSVENAHRCLFDEYSGYVYTICANKLKSCGTKEDIEECFSDSFADIFTYLFSR